MIPCFSIPVMLSFRSSKQTLSRFASALDMPSIKSCSSKALLVFRTRRPKVMYIQKRPRDKRAKCGEGLTTVVMTEPTLIQVILQQSLAEEAYSSSSSASSFSLSCIFFWTFKRIFFSRSSPISSTVPCLLTPLSMSPMLVKVFM